MKRTDFFKKLGVSVLSLITAASMLPAISMNSFAAEDVKWVKGDDGKQYWYENGVKQGDYGSPGNVWYNGTERGREIYDPGTKAWYWLDANAGGAKAVGKEVFMPYIYSKEGDWEWDKLQSVAYASNSASSNTENAKLGYQIWNAMAEGTGKWVRYDEKGAMLKGWVTIDGELAKLYPKQAGNTYYYDRVTGLMAKGVVEIDGVHYGFDRITGACLGETSDPTDEEVYLSKENLVWGWQTTLSQSVTPEGKVIDKTEYKLDDKCRVLSAIDYDTNWETDENGKRTYSDLYKWYEKTYTYENDKDRYNYKKTTTIYYNSNPEDNYKNYTTVEDYSKGNLIKSTTTYEKEDRQKDNKVVEYKYTKIGGYEYRSEEKTTYPNDTTKNTTRKYTYDEKGRNTEWIDYDASGEPKYKYTYEYNEKGDMTVSRSYNMQQGEWVASYRTENVYDAEGHQIESLGYSITGTTEKLQNKQVYTYKGTKRNYYTVTSDSWYRYYNGTEDTELVYSWGWFDDHDGPFLNQDGSKAKGISSREYSYDGDGTSTTRPEKPYYIYDYMNYSYPENPTNGQVVEIKPSTKVYDGDMNLLYTNSFKAKYYEYTVEN